MSTSARRRHVPKATPATTPTARISAARKATSWWTASVSQCVKRERSSTRLPINASQCQRRQNQWLQHRSQCQRQRSQRSRRQNPPPPLPRPPLPKLRLSMAQSGARKVSNPIQITTPVPDDDDLHEQLLDHSTRTRTANASALTSTNVTRRAKRFALRRASVTAGTTGVAIDATTLIPR